MIKIKNIKFYNHAIFNNQCFDFTINGNIANNIIIAGENGVGKTKFLEELYDIFQTPFYVQFENLITVSHELEVVIDNEEYCDYYDELHIIHELSLVIGLNARKEKRYFVNFKSNGNIIKEVKRIGTKDKITNIKLNALYSNVDINYKPLNDVSGPNNKNITNEGKHPRDMANTVIQHLVNIIIQDSIDCTVFIRENPDLKEVPKNILDRRLKRFTNAFSMIFGSNLVYLTLKNNSMPIFKKNNQQVEITSLSSGEKQIIFRGTYLLGNINSFWGSPVFIDEPEISMHPKWEDKIFSYYTSLFKEDNKQTSQIFMATHSEHILSESLKSFDSLVIKLEENKCTKFYKGSKGTILPSITTAEVNYIIFDIYSNDLHTLLYGYISSNLIKDKNGKPLKDLTIKKIDNFLKNENVTLKPYKYIINPKRNYTYETLPTYIRNCIDHPIESITYSEEELRKSIKDMVNVINKYKNC